MSNKENLPKSNIGPNTQKLGEEISKLYQQMLVQHHKNPFGYRKELNADICAEGSNPACGDEITVKAELMHSNKVLHSIAFEGESCAICRASASMMCQSLLEMSVENAVKLSHQIVNDIADNKDLIAPFDALNAVYQYPIRKQCALLPWTTFLESTQIK